MNKYISFDAFFIIMCNSGHTGLNIVGWEDVFEFMLKVGERFVSLFSVTNEHGDLQVMEPLIFLHINKVFFISDGRCICVPDSSEFPFFNAWSFLSEHLSVKAVNTHQVVNFFVVFLIFQCWLLSSFLFQSLRSCRLIIVNILIESSIFDSLSFIVFSLFFFFLEIVVKLGM